MKKQFTLIVLLILGLTGAEVGAQRYIHKNTILTPNTPIGSPAATTSNFSDSSEGINLADNRILLGFSHNVFVGRVLKELETTKYSWMRIPGVKFSVQPIFNIKGNLHDPVMVYQFKEEGFPALQAGSTYVFAGRYHREDDVYFILIYPYQYYEISQDASLSDAELQTLAQKDETIKGLQTDYPNEIVYSDDVDKHTTWNSYVSRRHDANSQLIDDTVELHKQFMATHPSPAPDAPADTAAPAENASVTDSVSPTATPAASTAPADTSPTSSPTDSALAPSSTPADSSSPIPSPTVSIPTAS